VLVSTYFVPQMYKSDCRRSRTSVLIHKGIEPGVTSQSTGGVKPKMIGDSRKGKFFSDARGEQHRAVPYERFVGVPKRNRSRPNKGVAQKGARSFGREKN